MTLRRILLTAGNAVTSAVLARFAMVEDVKRASDTRIATGNRLTLRMILQTAGNAAKNAVSAKCAMMENAKRASDTRIVDGN